CEGAGVPRPSVLVNSGHGTHSLWRLAEPYLIDDAPPPLPVLEKWPDKSKRQETDQPAKAKPLRPLAYVVIDGREVFEFFDDGMTANPEFPNELSAKARFAQYVLEGLAGAIGGDNVHDLCRLLRLPGTLNRKNQRNGTEPIPCQLIECDPQRRYPFSVFERFAQRSPDRVKDEGAAKIRLPSNKLTAARRNRLNTFVNAANCATDRSRADWNLICDCVERGLDK